MPPVASRTGPWSPGGPVVTDPEGAAVSLEAAIGTTSVMVAGPDDPPRGTESMEALIGSFQGTASAVVPVDRDDLAWPFHPGAPRT